MTCFFEDLRIGPLVVQMPYVSMWPLLSVTACYCLPACYCRCPALMICVSGPWSRCRMWPPSSAYLPISKPYLRWVGGEQQVRWACVCEGEEAGCSWQGYDES